MKEDGRLDSLKKSKKVSGKEHSRWKGGITIGPFYCLDCNINISRNSTRCCSCAQTKRYEYLHIIQNE